MLVSSVVLNETVGFVHVFFFVLLFFFLVGLHAQLALRASDLELLLHSCSTQSFAFPSPLPRLASKIILLCMFRRRQALVSIPFYTQGKLDTGPNVVDWCLTPPLEF